jgi:hypothetical protein
MQKILNMKINGNVQEEDRDLYKDNRLGKMSNRRIEVYGRKQEE